MNRRDFLTGLGTVGTYLLLGENTAHADEKKKPSIYLTIDDGPNKSMEVILEKLGADNRATFFVVGRQLEDKTKYALARKGVELGHELGNHSYSHPWFSKISMEKAKKEIMTTQAMITEIYKEVGKEDPRFFRFPFGDQGNAKGTRKHKEDIAAFLKSEGISSYLWDVDSGDWKHYDKTQGKSIDSILRDIGKAKDGDIVLVHDFRITAYSSIPFILQHYTTKSLKK